MQKTSLTVALLCTILLSARVNAKSIAKGSEGQPTNPTDMKPEESDSSVELQPEEMKSEEVKPSKGNPEEWKPVVKKPVVKNLEEEMEGAVNAVVGATKSSGENSSPKQDGNDPETSAQAPLVTIQEATTGSDALPIVGVILEANSAVRFEESQPTSLMPKEESSSKQPTTESTARDKSDAEEPANGFNERKLVLLGIAVTSLIGAMMSSVLAFHACKGTICASKVDDERLPTKGNTDFSSAAEGTSSSPAGN